MSINFENGLYTCTKTFKFEGAHVLRSSYSEECQDIHGHSYEVDVTIASDELNQDGMVIDFKELKDLIGHIFEYVDHAFILHSETYIELLRACPRILDFGWKMRVLGDNVNPTAENMAKKFYEMIEDALEFHDLKLICVKVRETKSGSAKFMRM